MRERRVPREEPPRPVIDRVRDAMKRSRELGAKAALEAAERTEARQDRADEIEPLLSAVEGIVRKKSLIAGALKEVFPDKSFTEQDITALLTDQEVMALPKLDIEDDEALASIAARIAEEME